MVNFAKNHPETVVYVKPRRHRGPVIKAEYCKYLWKHDPTILTFQPELCFYVLIIIFTFLVDGTTQWVNCRQFSRDEILKWLEHLKKQQTNHTGTRIRKLWHTENPSIQGPWTPFTFRDPKLNLAEFPNEELSKPLQKSENTYEELVELFKRQKLQKMNEEKNDPEKISASN